jgi:hypothetical protein
MVHCWVCGYKSKNLYHLLKKYKPNYLQKYVDTFLSAEDLSKLSEKEKQKTESSTEEEKSLDLPDDFCMLATLFSSRHAGHDDDVDVAMNYLKARGADSKETLWYWRMGISKANRRLSRRIIVPSFNAQGVLNYFVARSFVKGVNPKYENASLERENIIFNEINIDWTSELVLVEGVFDLIKCNENATTILGSELPGHFSLFQKIVENKTPVALALDPDAETKALKIAQRLFEFDIPVRIVEIDSALYKDVGEMSREQFLGSLQNAKPFNVEYLLKAKIRKIV